MALVTVIFVSLPCLVLVFLLCLILASLLYPPFPEEIEEPWMCCFHWLAANIGGTISRVVSKLTGRPLLEVLQSIIKKSIPKVHQNYPELKVEDLSFEGVPVRVYTPRSLDGLAPCIVYFHGGGWVLFSVDTYDALTTEIALQTRMIVVSVDYRLAPEHPLPSSIEDCVKATKYILQNGKQHGIDANRVAVIGDSAGGHLSTVVALKLANEEPNKLPSLKLHFMIYPVTQVVNFRTPSYLMYKNYPMLPKQLMLLFTGSIFQLDLNNENIKSLDLNQHLSPTVRHQIYNKYFQERFLPEYVRKNLVKDTVDSFGDEFDKDMAQKLDSLATDPYASPLLSDDSKLSKLPPAYFVIAEFDVLRDDGLLYAERLRQSGVKVELAYAKGHPHGFMGLTSDSSRYKGGKREWQKIYAYLNRNL